MFYEIETTRRGYRLSQHGCVLSEVLSSPGPTNSVFDFLAAAIAIFAPAGKAAVLGFAGGGLIAPLRAAGAGALLHGVDLDLEGYRLFRRVSGDWAGEVVFDREDAGAWLRRQPARFDIIVEDLSVPTEDDVIKPVISLGDLPALIRTRLKPGGVCVTNMLKPRGVSWDRFTPAFLTGHGSGCVVHLKEFENRLLIAGNFEASACWISRRIRAVLNRIGSDQADQFRVRGLGGG